MILCSDALYVEDSSHGTKVNIPQIESILALEGVPQDKALVCQHQKNMIKVKCHHLKKNRKIIARVSSAVSMGQNVH